MDIFLCVSFILYQFPNILEILQIPIIIFSHIYAYSTASTSQAAYIIGGRFQYGYQDIIAEFKNGSWRQIGRLVKERGYHGSITLENIVMIIGGASYDQRLVNFHDYFLMIDFSVIRKLKSGM